MFQPPSEMAQSVLDFCGSIVTAHRAEGATVEDIVQACRIMYLGALLTYYDYQDLEKLLKASAEIKVRLAAFEKELLDGKPVV